jgi:hypothetical protein
MIFRLASRRDAHQLALLHEQSSAHQQGGFMYRLGSKFLTKYYQILIDDGFSVIVCAVDESGHILGFVAGSLDATSRLPSLRKHRFSLLLASLQAIIRQPSLIKELLLRQNSGSADQSQAGYVVQSGTHLDFWAWQVGNKGGGAFPLLLKWLSIARLLGAIKVVGEVDKVNASILKAHKILGAKIVKEFTTPDGRQRFLIEYQLMNSSRNGSQSQSLN